MRGSPCAVFLSRMKLTRLLPLAGVQSCCVCWREMVNRHKGEARDEMTRIYLFGLWRWFHLNRSLVFLIGDDDFDFTLRGRLGPRLHLLPSLQFLLELCHVRR